MRFNVMISSSAALMLCSLLVVAGGCGGTATEEDGSGAVLGGGALGGAARSSDDATANGAEEEEEGEDEDSGKITICHVPPGNPANARTLTVSVNGWNGHQNHPGDSIGPCEGSDGGTSTPDDGGTTTPDDGGTQTDGGSSEPDEEPVCGIVEALCGGDGEAACCSGLECRDGLCLPSVIIN